MQGQGDQAPGAAHRLVDQQDQGNTQANRLRGPRQARGRYGNIYHLVSSHLHEHRNTKTLARL